MPSSDSRCLSHDRYSDKTDGYHQLRLCWGVDPQFKKYQQDVFLDVALNIRDLPPEKRPANPDDFKPCPMLIENTCVALTVPAPHLATSPGSLVSHAGLLARPGARAPRCLSIEDERKV